MQPVNGTGVIAAVLDSGIHAHNMAGVLKQIAPGAIVKPFDIGADGLLFDRKKVIDVFETFIIPQKIPVVNMSWGTGYLLTCPPWTNDPEKGFEHVFRRAVENGSILIAGSGNDFNGDIGICYPAISPYVIPAMSQAFGVVQRHPDAIAVPPISSSRDSAFLSAIVAMALEGMGSLRSDAITLRRNLHVHSRKLYDPITDLDFSMLDPLAFLASYGCCPATDGEADTQEFATHSRPPQFIGCINWPNDEDRFAWTSTVNATVVLTSYDMSGRVTKGVKLRQVKTSNSGNGLLTVRAKKGQRIVIAIRGPVGPYVVRSQSRS